MRAQKASRGKSRFWKESVACVSRKIGGDGEVGRREKWEFATERACGGLVGRERKMDG